MKVITTWFYTHAPNEPGRYAQVRGDTAEESFRDVYRRCIAVFFTTARIAEPDARLVLFLNVTWDANASPVAADVAELLQRLGVETVTIPYSHEPPQTWPAAWRNQFFVFDVLKWATSALAPDDDLLILDSDIVWSSASRTPPLWESIRDIGAMTLQIAYPPDHVINGLTRQQMSVLMANKDPSAPPISYCGGEFVAVSGRMVRQLYEVAATVLDENIKQSEGGTVYAFEEAHVLSVAYDRLGIPAGSANSYVKRIWTQPLKPKNVTPQDLLLTLWHVPAEKRYGIRRLYNRLKVTPVGAAPREDSEVGRALKRTDIARYLGVPRNSAHKWLSDIAYALITRLKGTS